MLNAKWWYPFGMNKTRRQTRIDFLIAWRKRSFIAFFNFIPGGDTFILHSAFSILHSKINDHLQQDIYVRLNRYVYRFFEDSNKSICSTLEIRGTQKRLVSFAAIHLSSSDSFSCLLAWSSHASSTAICSSVWNQCSPFSITVTVQPNRFAINLPVLLLL